MAVGGEDEVNVCAFVRGLLPTSDEGGELLSRMLRNRINLPNRLPPPFPLPDEDDSENPLLPAKGPDDSCLCS